MTGFAFDRGLGVRIAQNKLGQFVFETSLCVFPVAFSMAISTLLTQISFVFVVLFVATDAFLGRFLVHGALVTLFAFGLGMFTQQRKDRLVMVKLGGLFPVLFGMAFGTIFAQRLFMLIVLLVTSVAVLAKFFLVEWTLMTGQTSGCDVLATQHILGVSVMVKS